MKRAGFFILCVALAGGCGGDDSGGSLDSGGGTDGSATDGMTADAAGDGGGGGAISALTNTVSCYCASGADVSTCDTSITVTAYGPGNERLSDLTVTVNDEPVPWLASNYTTTRTGLDASYSFVAQRGGDVLSETHAAPSHFDLILEPATPVAGMPLLVTWDATDEPNVVVELGLSGPGMDFSAEGEADDGSITIPGTAFAGPGSYTLVVRRNAYVEGERFGARTGIDLTRWTTLTIE